MSGPIGPNGQARGDALAAQAHFGQWTDESGSRAMGATADAAVARAEIPANGVMGPLGVDAEMLTANATLMANDQTASIGLGATVAGGGVTLANDDRSLRVGCGFGAGLGGRAHYGDGDGDGNPEYGVGFDVGPCTVDVKDEQLGHMWDDVQGATKWAADGFESIYGPMGQHAGPIPDGSPMDYNLF